MGPRGCLCETCKHLDARWEYGVTDMECGKGWPCSCRSGNVPEECPGCPGYEREEPED